jgi:hypothetical protein
VNDVRTQYRVFFGVATFMALIAVVYWFASYEPAGTVMLGLAASLAAFCGVYLRLQDESATDAAHTGTAGGGESEYLPHSSVWPFGIGLGAWLTASGIIVGLAFAVPGMAVLAAAITGLVSQSRRRA